MTIRHNRENLRDVREERHMSVRRFELREDSDVPGQLVLCGYASTYQDYDMYGGPAEGGWIERIDRRAFDKTLREKPDVHLLINHEGMPLARTKSGTLQLDADTQGLKVTAKLDRSDPDVQRLEAKMRRGDMDEMSFAFRVKDQGWEPAPGFEDDDPYSLRTITEVSLHKGDVSVVNFGANPTTSAELKSVDQALAFLADCDPAQLAEVRSNTDILVRARAALERITVTPGAVDHAHDASSAVRAAKAGGASSAGGETDSRKGMSLQDALSRQGLTPPDGKLLSLDAALLQISSSAT